MSRIYFSFVLAICFSGPLFSQAVDQIRLVNGSRLEGNIGSASATELSINVKGSKRIAKVNEVKSVSFADEPAELTAGRNRVMAGKFAQALADLKKLNPASINRVIVSRDLQFYLAFAQAKVALSVGGDKPEATNAMLAFVRADPNNFHFFSAAEILGDLSVAQGDYASAVKYYSAISAKAPWPEFKMQAMSSEARALIQQGDFAEAQKKYEAISAMKSESKPARRHKLLAALGRGRCLAETGKADEGIRLIEKVIQENDPSDGELFGRAYNAHGDCFRKLDKPKQALMAYLHVDILFYSDPEIHAEALYHLSKLWAATNNDRAVAARTILDDRYPGSIWATKQ